MSVLSVSPSTPAITTTAPQPLTVELSLTNNTDAAKDVTVTGVRGAPFTSAEALDAALANPQPPQDSVLDIATAHPIRAGLAPGATATVSFVTTTSTALGAGICVCTVAGVYPLYFTATADGQRVGGVQTYLPAFFAKPTPLRVAWLWPLLERPHRIMPDPRRIQADDLFLDDDLAASVSGGRLDRALLTVEDAVSATPRLPLTLVVDPELLDELAVMASGSYRVQSPGKPATAGTGTAAASAWLARLRAVLAADPAIELDLTPLADPDYEQVTQAGLPWSSLLPDAVRTRIAAAVGRDVPNPSIAWPVSGAVHATILAAIARSGVSTAVLGPAAVRADAAQTRAAALTVSTAGGAVHLVPASADISTAVDGAALVGGTGAGALPALMAQLAVRVAADPTAEHDVLLVPPRVPDAAPDAAARAITATTSAFWTRPATLGQLTAAATDVPARVLASPSARAPRLSGATIGAAQQVASAVPALSSLLSADNAVVTELPVAIQRLESGAWVADSATGDAYATQLVTSVTSLETGVFIVRPSSGTYTLGSNNSPLPLTVQNDLDYPVHVVIHVETANGLPGFHAKDRAVTLDPHSKAPIHNLKATLLRNGRIEVNAVLRTPSGDQLGSPVPLSVRTTALGTIGFVITIVSGAVLAIALIRRFWKLYRRRGVPPPPVPGEPVATAGVV
jgi:hypothetical protein